jgi:glutamyl-tRNA synthetase
MTVITRFAPSPTGYLHIGGARTALFNYLYARSKKGKFILRIEDTDKKRSTKEATDAILDGLKWLGLNYDELYFQSEYQKRHEEVARALLNKGAAYYCYTSQAELDTKREEAEKNNKHYQFYSEWRDKDPKLAPEDITPVIRIKAPKTGSTIIHDAVQGKVEVQNSQLDDMVLLRSDDTPTYMLAVVVDDHDTNITHIIRGDDHLNNAFRQVIIYQAMDWKIPEMAHIPLIHGTDGKKLSKRLGAVGIDYYNDEGYLPDTVFNYLLRLGWSHGNDEIISRNQAIEWFNLESLGKSPSKLDFEKLRNLNAHYIKNADNNYLIDQINKHTELTNSQKTRLNIGLNSLKIRSKTINELIENCKIYLNDFPIIKDQNANSVIEKFDKIIAEHYIKKLDELVEWNEHIIKEMTNNFANEFSVKLGDIAQFLRALLSGTTISPSVFEIMSIIGKEESLKRLKDY